MSPSASPEKSESTARISYLKWLVGVLSVLCVALGVFSSYLLMKVDRSYSDLIDRSMPVMNELHRLNRVATRIHLRILNSRLVPDPSNREVFIKEIRDQIKSDRELRQTVCSREILSDEPSHAGGLKQAGEAYDVAISGVMDLLAQGRDAEADKLRVGEARPALKHYLDEVDTAADFVVSASESQSDKFTVDSRRHSYFMFGLAGFPLILVMGIMAVGVAVMVLFWLLLRRAGSGMEI